MPRSKPISEYDEDGILEMDGDGAGSGPHTLKQLPRPVLTEVLAVARVPIAACAKGKLSDAEANVVRGWWDRWKLSFGFTQRLSRQIPRLVEKALEDTTPRIPAMAEKLMEDTVDSAILQVMLAYHLTPRSGPIETLIDLLNGVYGHRQQLTASPRVLAVMTGHDQSIIADRLDQRDPLRQSGIIRVDSSDLETHLHPRLRGWVSGGMIGSPSALREAEKSTATLPGAVGDYVRDPAGLCQTLRGRQPVALRVDTGKMPQGLVRAILGKIAAAAGKPLFYGAAEDLRVALAAKPEKAGVLAVFGDEIKGGRFPFGLEDDGGAAPILKSGGMSLLWVGSAAPKGITDMLDGVLHLKCTTGAAAQLLANAAARARLPVSAETCLNLVSGTAILDPAGYLRVAQLAKRRRNLDPQAALRLHLGATVQARGYERGNATGEVPAIYDPRFVNCRDGDLARIEAAASRSALPKEARFLIVGPPGTGKSAWARYCASLTGREVQIRRASDFLGKYVGESEKQIAAWFGDLTASDDIGILDEADSFLWPRSRAQRSWEVSHTNEMLQQVETHRGPLFFTSNADLSNDRIDEAVLRRFIKLTFSPLEPTQARTAFEKYFGHPAPSGLDAISGLTTGDFAAVTARARVLGGLDDPSALVAMLAGEAALKPGVSRAIGFRTH